MADYFLFFFCRYLFLLFFRRIPSVAFGQIKQLPSAHWHYARRFEPPEAPSARKQNVCTKEITARAKYGLRCTLNFLWTQHATLAWENNLYITRPRMLYCTARRTLNHFFFFCVERKIGGGFSRFGTCVRFPEWGNLRTPLLFRKNPPAPLIAVSWGSRHFIERRFIEHRFVEAVLRNPLHRTIFCLWTFVAASSSRL